MIGGAAALQLRYREVAVPVVLVAGEEGYNLDGMAEVSYRDLAEFGLPLVTPDTPQFASLAAGIESRPGPGPPLPPVVTDRAGVLLNQSGRAIIGLEFVWRYTTVDGKTRASRCSTLGSSAQREVLTGRSKVGRDLGTFILPDSKRLITEQGIFGNNLDVLAPDDLPRGRGYCGGFGGGGGFRGAAEEELAGVELVLDLVILEDGLCVGPDESGLFEDLNESLDLQRRAAQEAVAALRNGASEGRIFEIVRPLARHRPPSPAPGGKSRPASSLLPAFGSEAIHRLIDASAPELLAWFERAAEPRTLQLRRPSK